MPERKARYEAMLEEAKQALQQSPNEFKKWVETSEEVVKAMSDMTKDELALIKQYLRRDLKEFGENVEKPEPESFKDSQFYQGIVNTIWQNLAEITDQTQIEWHEIFADIEHGGVYHAGEIIGLGKLVCEQCGHEEFYYHPQPVSRCIHCDHDHFARYPLDP
uniref:zinc ribbon-containing protein n=1 Tax=Thaumasiovibrio occultus TaxID=1891184 RepID=UPI000B3616F5|nr:zinc ribbon-containing protein [Thaumasiovibrio occultus]